ncbi:hypothetical protein [Marinobacter mangrovi]|uniref:hypothetical protein n=1 Tax=Marinobacter mangrovi TaxID=2803918 RepID=UPI0019343492|nr:hypothetical protein [Marinobacter mangrovi]
MYLEYVPAEQQYDYYAKECYANSMSGSSFHVFQKSVRLVDDKVIAASFIKGITVLRLKDIKFIELRVDHSDASVCCNIWGHSGTGYITLCDYSLVNGLNAVAEVKRKEFVSFIETLLGRLKELDLAQQVECKYVGPETIKIELIEMFWSFLFAPIVMTILMTLMIVVGVPSSSTVMTTICVVLVFPLMFLGWYISPRVVDSLCETCVITYPVLPERLFELADGVITRDLSKEDEDKK